MKKNTLKTAFTLAEVLITLGVIGVVVAMTIPNLMQKNFEKHAVSKLKKTQSILAQAFKMAEEEYGDVEGWGLTAWNSDSAALIAEYLKPFLKISVDCGLTDEDYKCVIKGKYNRLNGTTYDRIYSSDDRYYKISLLNGVSLWWRAAAEGDTLIYIWVDINGKTLPNTYGKDLFIFSYENGSILPDGSPNSGHPAETNCTKNSTGWGCAYYVIMQGNMNYLH